MSDTIIETILSRLDLITNPSERAVKIKDEANQFFKGIYVFLLLIHVI